MGKDLVAFFRDAASARDASDRLRRARVRHTLTTDIPEGDPLEIYRARSKAFTVGRRFWIDPGELRLAGAARPNRAARSGVARVRDRQPRVDAARAAGAGGRNARGPLGPGRGNRIRHPGAGGGGPGRARAVGLDTDSEAVFVARENCVRHPFGGRVRLYAGPLAACQGAFDLVVANLLAEELLPEARHLLARAGRAGRVLVSGITREREAAVLARLRTGRWKLAGRRTEDEWSCLCLARAS